MSAWPWPAFAAVCLWGGSFVATRLALEGGFEAAGLVVVRFFLGLGVLFTWARVRNVRWVPRPGDRRAACLLGAILALHLGLQTWGLEHTTAIHTSWIVAFMPVAMTLGARAFLNEELTGLGWVGVGLGVVGVATIVGADPGEFQHARFGDLLQLATIPTWAAYSLLGAGVVARSGALPVTLFAMASATLLLLFPTLLGPGFWSAWPTGEAWGATLFLGVLCSGLAYTLWYVGQARHGSSSAAAMLYFEPLVTVGLAAGLLGEPLSETIWLGGGLVLFGVFLVQRARIRRRRSGS